MITYQEARRKVLDYLAVLESEAQELADLRKDLTQREREVLGFAEADEVTALVISGVESIAGELGWVFFYQSKDYLDTGDPATGLIGNAPIIVSKADGSLHVTGTAESVEVYVENFKRSGDPFG